MAGVTELMREDNQRLELMFDEFKAIEFTDYPKAALVFSEFSNGMRRHIGWEDALFKLAAGSADCKAVIDALKSRHAEIGSLLGKIADKLRARDIDTLNLEMDLDRLVQGYYRAEQERLYSWLAANADKKALSGACLRIGEEIKGA